jgi:hypothetical protein
MTGCPTRDESPDRGRLRVASGPPLFEGAPTP